MKMRVALLLSLGCVAVCLHLSGRAEEVALPMGVEDLFARLTRPPPDRLVVEAHVEVRRAARSEKEIMAELKRQESLMRETERDLGRHAKEELRAARLEGIRSIHSGVSSWDITVWRSGPLYRKDEVQLSIPAPSTFSYVHIGDPSFTNVVGYWDNQTVRSATLYTDPTHLRGWDPVWQAFTAEPELALLFVQAIADQSLAPGPPTENDPHPFSGWRFDEDLANALVSGSHPVWELSTTEERIGEGIRTVCFRLNGRGSPFKGFRATYWLDAVDSGRLHRMEVEVASGAFMLRSLRKEFGLEGFPRWWQSERLDGQGRLVTRTVTFQEVNVNPKFEDWTTFAPVFPTNYIVAVMGQDGIGEVIQNPAGAPVGSVTRPGGRATAMRRLTAWALFVVLIAVPLWFFRKTRSPAPKCAAPRC